ncbi:MAG: AraC family transcriptional regulator [Sphingobacteriaceae bacterium]|nr:AraC family transcriptional regulator [Cytophagaceae bacterium]
MKSALRKDLEDINGSYAVRELVEPYFDPNWHFHPHYQISFVQEGTGTRFVGDSIQSFSDGDLVLLGPNVPHLWRSDQRYHEEQSDLMTKVIVVYFAEDFLGERFFSRPEMVYLDQLLKTSIRGLHWYGQTHQLIARTLQAIVKETPNFQRLLMFLNLLDQLSHSTEYHPLTSPDYSNTMKPSETKRMQVVHSFVMENFRETISLNEVADQVGMSPSAFSRYFKLHANKTFSEFITEIRVGQACKLLIEDNLNVTQISYDCGFQTQSNFNRQFKQVTNLTPSQYKKTYRLV